MTWQPHFEENYAIGYNKEGTRIGHKMRTRVDAAGSMDTTTSDYTRFKVAIMKGNLLSTKARTEMLRPQIEIRRSGNSLLCAQIRPSAIEKFS